MYRFRTNPQLVGAMLERVAHVSSSELNDSAAVARLRSDLEILIRFHLTPKVFNSIVLENLNSFIGKRNIKKKIQKTLVPNISLTQFDTSS